MLTDIRNPWARRLLALITGLGWVALGWDSSAHADRIWTNIATRRENLVIQRASYDYAPSVMLDGRYRMWWCGGVAGDFILYAEAESLDGPWSDPIPVFQPTGNAAQFDGLHTCDPSVVRAAGRYYLYYGGLAADTPGNATQIGVAQSRDGLTWTRLNGGQPILVPHGNADAMPNPYGAGQPSVTYVDGLFYLIYTDTTGQGSIANGAGQYVLRSPDPTFQTGLEELTARGFVPRRSPADITTEFSLLNGFSVDWQYVDLLDAFLVVKHNVANQTDLVMFHRSLQGPPLATVALANSPWSEGPGIVSRPDRHALPSLSNPTTVPIDVLRSVQTGAGVSSWEIALVGMDLQTSVRPAAVPYAQLLEGFAIRSASGAIAWVVDGQRFQPANAELLRHLTHNVAAVSDEVFAQIPYGASLPLGAAAVGASGRPAAFILADGRAWPVGCPEVIAENGSSIRAIAPEEYDALPKGPALRCVGWRPL
ncbi:MAG: beta-xylosidase [Elainellaceae cyanobacterium]